MAILQIPTRTDADNYGLTIALEGSAYEFAFAWNYRSSSWTMSITGVVDGVALRIGVDPLATVSVSGRPPGAFMVVDTSGADADPGLNELGGRVLLLYRESGA